MSPDPTRLSVRKRSFERRARIRRPSAVGASTRAVRGSRRLALLRVNLDGVPVLGMGYLSGRTRGAGNDYGSVGPEEIDRELERLAAGRAGQAFHREQRRS